MKINLIKILNTIILIGILITPLVCMGDLYLVIINALPNYSSPQASIFFKILKDIIFLLMFIITFIIIFKRHKISKFINIFIILYVYILAGFLIQFINIPLVALCGLRWSLPIFLIVLLINRISIDLMKNIASILMYLSFLNLFLQIIEKFFLLNYFSWRATGFYIVPSTTGFFNSLVLFYVYFFIDSKSKLRIIALIGIIISNFLAMSGTGTAVCLLFWIFILSWKKISKILLIFFPLVLILILPLISFLTMRHKVVEQSLWAKFGFFFNVIANVNYLPIDFGKGTNMIFSLANKYGINLLGIVADSTYTSILVNLGLIGFIMILIVSFFWILILFKNSNLDAIIFTIIYMLFGVTMIIFEAYPMNILFSIGMAYYIPIILTKNKIVIKNLKNNN